MDDYQIEMGLRIKKIRKKLGYTQEKLAEQLGITNKHLGDVERGTAGLSMKHLLNLCDILGTDLNYLVCGISSETEINSKIPGKWNDLYLSCPLEKRHIILSLVETAIQLS